MKQVDAVVCVTLKVLAKNGIAPTSGIAVASNVTAEMRREIVDEITAMILSGDVELGSRSGGDKYSTEAAVKTYVRGLVTNHFTKCPKLNGGNKTQSKSSGKTAGIGRLSSNPEIRALQALAKSLPADSSERQEIEAEIAAKVSELASTKVPEINWDLIPEELRAAVSSTAK